MWLDKYEFSDVELLTTDQLVQSLKLLVQDLGYTVLIEKDTKQVLLTKFGEEAD